MARPISILLIDDDEEDFIITRDILSEIPNRKYHLDWEGDYEQARRRIRQKTHDVYLVDYRLGIRSGLDLVRDAKAFGCEAPMILLTGQNDPQVDEEATAAGASDYLVKNGLTSEMLERSMRYSLRQADILGELRTLNTELEDRVVRRTKALSEAVEDLRQSQQLYRSIAHNFPDGVIGVIGTEWEIVLLDGKALNPELALKSQEESTSFLDLVPEKDRSFLKTQIEEVFKGEEVEFDYTFRGRIYSLRCVPLKELGGSISRILLVATDMSRQREAEEEMRKALHKERQLNELKSRFISMASHEFRTPLSTILSSVSLLGRYTEGTQQPKRDKHINRIKSNVANLTNILNDFLSLSKMEEGKLRVSPSAFDLGELNHEIAEELQSTSRPGQVIRSHHKGKGEVYLDKQVVSNIMLNLLSNAIKYSPQEKPIDLHTEVKGDKVKIIVADQGIGIPKDEQGSLFERFFRARNAVNYQGTGLGLNIVQKYLHLLEGEIEFTSEENVGTTFTVTLPQSVEEAYPKTNHQPEKAK